MKKIITVFMSVILMAATAGCGGKSTETGNDAATGYSVTINGKAYDLTENFEDVVGQMVKNGKCVVSPKMETYGEDGQAEGKVNFMNPPEAFLTASGNEMSEGEAFAYRTNRYFLSSEDNISFQTKEKLTEKTGVKQLEELTGFLEVQRKEDGYACAALYVDGKIVDFTQYQGAEEWIFDSEKTPKNEDGLVYAFTKVIPDSFEVLADLHAGETEIANLSMLQAAVYGATEQYAKGEVKSVCLVRYLVVETPDGPVFHAEFQTIGAKAGKVQ